MAQRSYEKGDLIVHWDSDLCYHSAHCIKNAPAVFDSARRPWVQLDLGTEEEIVRAVDSCPSGALTYSRVGEDLSQIPPTTIRPTRNGPLIVSGRLQVVDRNGAVVREAKRLALCRCGHSGNRPFCDGSHARERFRDPGLPGAAPGPST